MGKIIKALNVLIIYSFICFKGIVLASDMPKINSGIMLANDIEEIKRSVGDVGKDVPIVTFGDICSIISGMYEYNDKSYTSANVFGLIDWTQGKVNNKFISAVTAGYNMNLIEQQKHFPVFRINDKPYKSPDNGENNVRFSFIFYPQILLRVGPNEGYLFHIDRKRLEGDDIKPFDIESEEVKAKIKAYKQKYIIYPMPMMSVTEVEFMNSIEKGSAYFSELMYRGDNLVNYSFCVNKYDAEIFLYKSTSMQLGYFEDLFNSLDKANKIPVLLRIPELNNLFKYYQYIQKNQAKALEYNKKAIVLGSVGAIYDLAILKYQNNDITGSMDLLHLATKFQYSPAINDLGTLYYNNEDYKKSFCLFQKGVELMDEQSHINLACMYISGQAGDLEPLKRFKKARQIFKQAVMATNSVNAMIMLGELFEKHLHVRKWKKKSLSWYKRAEASGYIAATIKVGEMYEKSGNILQAIQSYKKAINYYQDIRAMVKLATIYLKHYRQDKLHLEAFNLLNTASSCGDKEAMYYLVIYFRNHIPKTSCYQLLSKSSTLGHIKSIRELGTCYLYGEGTKINYEKAMQCFEKAADVGDKKALFYLGYMHEKGMGVEVNYSLAKKYYEQASGHECPKALTYLGLLYKNGLGIEANLEKAANLFEKANKLGDKCAPFFLGLLFEEGLYNNENFDSEDMLYQTAIERGNSKAMMYVANKYLNSPYKNTNLSYVLDLLKKAAFLGDEDAAYMLGFSFFVCG